MSQCKCGEHVFEELQLRLDCRTYQTSGRRRHGSGLVNDIALSIQKDKFTSTHVRGSAHTLANIYHVLGSCVKKSIIFSDCSIWYFVVIFDMLIFRAGQGAIGGTVQAETVDGRPIWQRVIYLHPG